MIEFRTGAYLQIRGIDPGAVELHDLAHGLQPDQSMPGWARSQGSTWYQTWPLVVPLWAPDGRMVSVHARSIDNHDPKSVSPTGYTTRSTVMANPLGRLLLARDETARSIVSGIRDGFGFWIAEGATDFLTLATSWSDADDCAPAIWSVLAGSWAPEFSERVPDSTRIAIATDADKAGDAYAAQIADAFKDRKVSIFRVSPKVSSR